MRYFGLIKLNAVVMAAVLSLTAGRGEGIAAKCPCDIYKDGGTPCVAAHSTVRALYESFDGPLYQLRRASDSQTKDIGVKTRGGYVNTAVVDSFLRGTTGTVAKIYDQSERKNDLTKSLYGSAATNPLKEAPATRLKDTISGNILYPLATEPGEGYRNNKTNGVATGNQAEGMYMVCSGKRFNAGCCWDYGNAESDAIAGGKPTGAMEALYFGSNCWFKPCNGSGPWMFADLEWGLFQGSVTNGTTNISLPYEYVSGYLKGELKTYTIRANDATQDVLKLMGSSNRPSAWQTGLLTGAIILGIGGDSSPSGRGVFYEGAMTIGRPSDSTENAVQKNISLVYSHKDTIPSTGVHTTIEKSPATQRTTARYNSSTGSAVFSYFLPEAQRVSITVLDQCGRQVTTIAGGIRPAGRNTAIWNSVRVPAGIYLWKIVADGRDGGAGKVVIGK